ncbi:MULTISPECIES: methyltransferase domain-containing protein [Pseudomonas]|jgi:arsenite methyltransferase|uniref:Arsenite methyltransferase n=1 Tax=Pseudomonas kielensis TaxID=2762577 RepID=A0A7X1L127_9PSED|nr:MULTISPECIES: methyltransferase domain-containing protein [Pseudomonas]MBC2693581.1 methyltransferase domain-containing protein [Pseudomonas kielensis]
MRESVQNYYGKVLQSNEDLKTSACCDVSDVPTWLKQFLANIHPEVSARYYGCGLVAPALLEGCRVLDLGSGSGRDCYVLAQVVGENGAVVGVDMTTEQLAVAKEYLDYHTEQFGFSNVRFLEGYIEDLGALGLADAEFDVIVSNCVINLSPDKDSVLSEAYRLLKPGGELYFSDIYADRRLPESLRQDEVLYGECLGGAMYWNDFENLARRYGFNDPRLVEDRPIEITDATLAEKLGDVRFFSATYRLFKLDNLELACEDYGQAVIYQGSIPGAPAAFVLDKHHRFETGRIFPVCGNSWRMLQDTRFNSHFQFIGTFNKHFGMFEGCGRGLPFEKQLTSTPVAATCC